jgi:hypothetical protein
MFDPWGFACSKWLVAPHSVLVNRRVLLDSQRSWHVQINIDAVRDIPPYVLSFPTVNFHAFNGDSAIPVAQNHHTGRNPALTCQSSNPDCYVVHSQSIANAAKKDRPFLE